MKKFFSFLLMATMLLAVGASVTSCSSEGDADDVKDNSKEVAEFLEGKEWYLGDGGRTYSFYRNHMVLMDAGGVAVGGAFTGGYDWAFGTWQVTNGNLFTKFDVCANSNVNPSKWFYETISSVYRDPKSPKIKGKLSDGSEVYLSLHKNMTDYTDDTSHDKALHGTWVTDVHEYNSNTDLQCTMIINPDGTVVFRMSDGRQDVNTTYTTKNGHVNFAHYLTAGIENQSFIYLRNEIMIQLIGEKDGLIAWRWYKKQK